MPCDLWRNKIDASTDGELEAKTQREFDAHLRNCASCAAEIAARARLKIAVKRAALRRFNPSAEFRKQIDAQVVPQKHVARFSWFWIPALGAAAAILVAALWIADRPARNSAGSALGEIADLHVAALASASPVDVISTDLHTVKPWFEGRVPFAVNLPDLTHGPFTLLGGRVAYLDQRPGAGLLFRFLKHRLSVFIFQDRAQWKEGVQGQPEQHASFWIETWSANGLRYFVIGDTSAENVQQLSDLMKSAAGPG